MLKRGAKGDEVRELQRALIELGYELPRWGADGDLGAETIDAFARFLRDHSTEIEDDANVVSDEELALLSRIRDAARDAPLGPQLGSGRFHDLRAMAVQTSIGGHRAWKAITGVVLHQTACVFGELPRRWASVGAHLGVTRGGQVIWLHDFEKIVWHANRFNGFTVGIEMDGTYAGIEGDDRTFWRPAGDPQRQAQTPTDALVGAAQATVRWICAEVARHGGRVERLLAHRQASNERQSDPGSALWKRVARALHADPSLGLTDGGPGYVVGNGLPIPEAWDETRTGVRY
ncbi:MAG TPA: N-acetylmuramoyl-L-alanine amidase [Kofleriaceae bacterium]|nr:N-acetylmuramoyl-L-alanine amidase [Kofleriaceae bacterium]